MRPYLDRDQTSEPIFLDIIYAISHLAYTLNDYNRYRLPHDLLPRENEYLRRNLPQAIALKDPETMREFLDTLKSFGLNNSDEVIRQGVTYLLDTQRADGTWSPPEEKDPYTLYHSAWTGIDGLKECRWQGEGLSFPPVRGMIEGFRQVGRLSLLRFLLSRARTQPMESANVGFTPPDKLVSNSQLIVGHTTALARVGAEYHSARRLPTWLPTCPTRDQCIYRFCAVSTWLRQS